MSNFVTRGAMQPRFVATCEVLEISGTHLGVDLDSPANNHQLALVRNIQPAKWLKDLFPGFAKSRLSAETTLARTAFKHMPGYIQGSKHVDPKEQPAGTMWVSTIAPPHEWKDQEGRGKNRSTGTEGDSSRSHVNCH
jgi:hypothetical protein